MKKFMVFVAIAACSSLMYASDTNKTPLALGSFTAKQYTVPTCGNDHASSRSFFALTSMDGNKIFVFDRRKKYEKYVEHIVHLDKEQPAAVAIVDDAYLVSGQKIKDGLCVYTIGDEVSKKNIKFNPIKTDPSICELHSMSNKAQFLARCSDGDGLLFDVESGALINRFKENRLVSVLPNQSGDGVWCVALQESGKSIVVHRDLRFFDKITTSVEVPGQVGKFSVSPDGKYFAVTDLTNRLFIFDVNTRKRELIVIVASDRRIQGSIFADNSTLVHDSGKICGGKYELQSVSLSSGHTNSCALSHNINGVSYHYNTGLLVGNAHSLGFEIYDFGLNKKAF